MESSYAQDELNQKQRALRSEIVGGKHHERAWSMLPFITFFFLFFSNDLDYYSYGP